MEIEFENDDYGDDINNGDAECLFCKGLSSHEKTWRKMGTMFEVLSLGA
jgi:hypothetical protein